MSDTLNLLGERIKKLRKKMGFSQEYLAEKLDIATTTLSNIETGKSFMTFQTMQKLLNIFKIKPFELFLFGEVNHNEALLKEILKKINDIKNDDKKLVLLFNFLDILE